MPAIVWTYPNPIERHQLLELLQDFNATITVEDATHIHVNGIFTCDELRPIMPQVSAMLEMIAARVADERLKADQSLAEEQRQRLEQARAVGLQRAAEAEQAEDARLSRLALRIVQQLDASRGSLAGMTPNEESRG